ncbi:mechanosensitive ion channel family protein [Sphingobium sufflavum]|nr:mechanosensitive ion channel family protein [Sphingobium sufflavum]
MDRIAQWSLPIWLIDTAVVAVAIFSALVIHAVAMSLFRRLAARTPDSIDDILVAHARSPLRWLMIGFTLAFVREQLHLTAGASLLWSQAAGIIVPGLGGWLAIALIRAGARIVEHRYDITVADNLSARRRRTRSAIMTRILVLTVGFVTICLMLLSIPSIRTVGVTLMASAGIAALAVGAAAQPALKNLIAGIQMAFTEPIRIDDVVIIDNEWGRIEEIFLTYVVVALWDERRLVVPVSRFLEQSFQNWTRHSSQLLGSAFLYLDPSADIARLRAKSAELIESNPRWDRRFHNMQVTDVKPEAVEVRILATARDASTAFDLRCDIREGLLAFVRDEMPEALPRSRQINQPSPLPA